MLKILKHKNQLFKKKHLHKKHKPFKLKKKFRFWRLYKSYFLYRKRVTKFTKYTWLFNMRRILKHQYFSIYGTSIKSISFYKKTKYAFDKPFFDFLYLTEFILKILLLRARFFLKLIDTIKFINKKGIAVNGKLQTYINFSVKPNSLIQKCRKFPIYRPTFKKKKWRRFRWKSVRYILKRAINKSYINLYLHSRNNVTLNCLEINYSTLSFIPINYPKDAEIFIGNNKINLAKTTLSSLYFIY